MKTTIIYPKSEVLKKYIQYFLFLKNEDPNYQREHICFPNTNYCLGLHKGNRLAAVTNSRYSLLPSLGFHSYLTGIYQSPIYIQAKGVFDEVCIDFEPLGIDVLSGQTVSTYTYYDEVLPYLFPKNFKRIFHLAFSHPSPKQRAKQLEAFFLTLLPKEMNTEFIPFNQNGDLSIPSLKKTYRRSYRSIYRMYKKNIDLSPKEFSSIVRIRKGIAGLNKESTLTSVAYKAGFSDQSHMIREFKKYTHQSPRLFQRNSTAIDGKVWMSIR